MEIIEKWTRFLLVIWFLMRKSCISFAIYGLLAD